MITQSQQKTLSELQEFFDRINSLESPPTSIMEEIGAELNKAEARKLKKDASQNAAYAMAFEAMTKYADEVVRPIVNRFINGSDVQVQSNGKLWIGGGGYYQTFIIESVFIEDPDKTEFRKTVFHGFKLDHKTYSMDLHDFDQALKKFVIDTAKSRGNLYY